MFNIPETSPLPTWCKYSVVGSFLNFTFHQKTILYRFSSWLSTAKGLLMWNMCPWDFLLFIHICGIFYIQVMALKSCKSHETDCKTGKPHHWGLFWCETHMSNTISFNKNINQIESSLITDLSVIPTSLIAYPPIHLFFTPHSHTFHAQIDLLCPPHHIFCLCLHFSH